MRIHLDTIRQRLFDDPVVRSRVLRDYSVTTCPATPEDFARAVVDQLDQTPAPRPLDQQLTNGDVFRAVVKALASNSRAWATFLRFDPRLQELLRGYDPGQTQAAFEQGALTVEAIKACLPGQSSTADAAASGSGRRS